MKRKILWWEISGVAFTIVLGSILHFLYEWSGFWKPLALFAAVNESVWEHIKMGFWPALIFTAIEYFFIRKSTKNFLSAKAASLLLIPILISILFYGYTSILGHNILPIDISIFFITIIAAFILSYKLLTSNELPAVVYYCSIVVLIILLISFSTFTFFPPHLELFKDWAKGGYGLK